MVIRFSFLLIIVLFTGCFNNKHKKVVVQHPDGYYREVYFVINDSIKDGSYQKFFPDGKLWDSCYYKNDTLHGKRKIFSNKGFLEIQENYNNGILDGDYFLFYPDGKVKLKQTLINGAIEGFSYGYYPSGAIKEKVKMVKNEENGSFEEYHENGKIHWKGTYLNGNNEQDTLYEYNTEGTLIKKMFCQNGVCSTLWSIDK
ncbi:MAG: toxin-antitoxin system YwqK family antitoxin [Deltaproteobacteria bacterium]